MLLSIRCIGVLATSMLIFAIVSEAFIGVPKYYVSRIENQRIMRSIGIPFGINSNYVARHASTVVDEQIDEKELVGKLRSSMVTNVNNELVSLGDIMGSEKSVVIFLRHLG